MGVYFWQAPAAVAAGVPYAPPASAGVPRVAAVRAIQIQPQASGVTTANIFESGVASGAGGGTSGAAAAGQATFSATAQQFASGDAIPANAVILVNVVEDGGQPINP